MEPKIPPTIDTMLFLQFVKDLWLADHLGDVWNDVDYFLKRVGIELEHSSGDEKPYEKAFERLGIKYSFES